jgi:hypothetical protein
MSKDSMELKVEKSCRFQDQLLKVFDRQQVYKFQYALVKIQNNLNKHLNNLEAFDVILSTPKSGKFIELCFEAGASFYQVRIQ